MPLVLVILRFKPYNIRDTALETLIQVTNTISALVVQAENALNYNRAIHRVSILPHTITLKSIYFALLSISFFEGKPYTWMAWRNVQDLFESVSGSCIIFLKEQHISEAVASGNVGTYLLVQCIFCKYLHSHSTRAKRYQLRITVFSFNSAKLYMSTQGEKQ